MIHIGKVDTPEAIFAVTEEGQPRGPLCFSWLGFVVFRENPSYDLFVDLDSRRLIATTSLMRSCDEPLGPGRLLFSFENKRLYLRFTHGR